MELKVAVPGTKDFTYDLIALDDSEIDEGKYKKYLGGGARSWEQRGGFQLKFLIDRGLSPIHKMLDIGCGPGRAGRYLIDYLNSNSYVGIDYNQSFIDAFVKQLSIETHKVKRPLLKVTTDFELDREIHSIDFAIAFSVLNHCRPSEKERFFFNIPQHLTNHGKIYISHADWFNESYIRGTDLEPKNAYTQDEYDITEHGWAPGETIFPIIELEIVRG